MKVLHTIPRLKETSGGPPLCTALAVIGLRGAGVDTHLLSYQLASPADKNVIEGDFVHFVSSPKETVIAYAPSFKNYLLSHRNYDVIHCQCVWQYPTFIAAKIARKFKVPHVITPHGMLYPQMMRKNPAIKKLMWNLFLKNDLQKATCIQATCVEEKNHLRNLGITTPIAIVANAIDTGPLIPLTIPAKQHFTVGYLGRVHRRKNIERLIYAWANLGDAAGNGKLMIIGADDETYLEFLKNETRRLNLSNVVFTGFLSGQQKLDTVASLSYLVVPSDFENFGMIIAEALALGVPVIASKGTPWQELESYQCGWWIDNDVDSVTRSLQHALQVSEAERIQMGMNGKRLIAEKYSVVVIGEQIKQLYEWLLGEREKPSFVYI